jgi:hypothetical protein
VHPRRLLLARLLCLALLFGVFALELPLDALRGKVDRCCAASIVDDCCDGCGEPGVTCDDASPLEDGCVDGCQCGCCGGMAIAAEPLPGAPMMMRAARGATLEKTGARRDGPREVFHPPRA